MAKKQIEPCTKHRYIRVNIGNKKEYIVFRCMNMGCNHYIPKKLALNKPCVCNRCGDDMVLDTRAMLLEKPHCINCVNTRNIAPETKKGLADFIREMEGK